MSAAARDRVGPLPVRQQRAERTLARLLDAAREVIAERGVEAATVPAITSRAGMSVGNFYRRFPGKEALLDHVERELFAGRRQFWDDLLQPARWRDRGPEALVERVVAEIVRRHADNRDLLRAVAARARADYEQRASEVAPDLPSRLQALLESVWPGWVRHPNRELAVGMAIEMVSATAGEVLLFRQLENPPTAEALIDELTRACVAYLRAADSIGGYERAVR